MYERQPSFGSRRLRAGFLESESELGSESEFKKCVSEDDYVLTIFLVPSMFRWYCKKYELIDAINISFSIFFWRETAVVEA